MWLYQARRYMPGADPTVYDVSETTRAVARPDSGRLGLRHRATRPGPSGDVHRGPPQGDRRRPGQRRHRARRRHVPPPEVLVSGRVPGLCDDWAGAGPAHAEGRQARGPDARSDRHLRLLRPARTGRGPDQGRPLLRPSGPAGFPNIVLGRARARGSCGGASTRAAPRSRFPRGLDRLLAVARGAAQTRRRPRPGRASVVVIRIPRLPLLRARGCSTCTSGRQYLRVAGLAFLGVPGALLHRHGHRPVRQSRQGPGDALASSRSTSSYSTPQFIVVRHSDGDAGRGAGDDWRTHAHRASSPSCARAA